VRLPFHLLLQIIESALERRCFFDAFVDLLSDAVLAVIVQFLNRVLIIGNNGESPTNQCPQQTRAIRPCQGWLPSCAIHSPRLSGHCRHFLGHCTASPMIADLHSSCDCAHRFNLRRRQHSSVPNSPLGALGTLRPDLCDSPSLR